MAAEGLEFLINNNNADTALEQLLSGHFICYFAAIRGGCSKSILVRLA